MISPTWVSKSASALSGIVSNLDKAFSVLDTVFKWIDDIKVIWPLILAGIGIAILLGTFYCYFMRCCAGVMAWIMIFLLLLTFWGGGAIALSSAMKYQDDIDAAQKNAAASVPATVADVSDDEYNRNWCYAGCGVLWLLAFIFSCIVCCNYHKIQLIIAIIKAASRFVTDNLCMLATPVINTLIAIALVTMWIIGIIFLYSVGTITKNPSYPWSSVEWETFTEVAWYFNLFMGLWLIAFMVSLNAFVVGAAAVIWYFQQGPQQENGGKSTRNPCCTGYLWAFGYHMGSIAFGSFILAVVWAIQIIFAYIQSKMKDAQAQNKCIACMFSYIQYCLNCFERCIVFLNKMAYIQIALTGKSFCGAAFDGFVLVINHAMEFGLLAMLGGGFMFLCVAVITGGSAVLIWLIINNTDYFNNVSSVWFPIVLIAIIAWMIAKLFTGVYMIACYAILQSFYVDAELQKAKNGPPRHTPAELMDFIDRAKGGQ